MQVQFGVENLNLCNLQSLCIMDMKIFLYLTSFQAISFLKSLNSTKNPNFLLPYWLVSSNICTKHQQEWWSLCYDLLFKTVGKKTLDHIDIKAQNNLIKILELIRLKSSMVKLGSETISTKHGEKLKLNIKTCMKLVKYLEYTMDTLKSNKSDKLYCSFVSAASESFCTPKDKLDFLRRYKLTYWNFVTRQLIKLRQLSLINDQNVENLDTSSVLFGNNSFTSTIQDLPDHETLPLKHCTPYLFTPKLLDKSQIEIKNYFDYYECNLVKKNDEENSNANTEPELIRDEFEFDSAIETGILSLILNYVQIDSFDENEIDSDLNENELELIQRVHVSSISNLNEAISLFNLADGGKDLENSFNECDTKYSNKLNFFQLQVIYIFNLSLWYLSLAAIFSVFAPS
jgi:hypothetical protein